MNREYVPIWGDMKKILAPLREGKNLIIAAPPGSGKTTQVPQAILDNGLSGRKQVFVVEPRRLACRSAAHFIASERGTKIGAEVGYIVRNDVKISSGTKICFITDGVLLRFLEDDMKLSKAAVVIFDEFHERRINSDLGLALLRAAQQRRRDLRIIVMSATMETEALARYLDAAVVTSSMLTFPVLISYIHKRPAARELSFAIATEVMRYNASGKPGHILVFLPGKGAILEATRVLEKNSLKDLVILPLHGEMNLNEQNKVFEETDNRKVILATNVAESSLTIPGVRMVIDSGLERRHTYDFSTAVSTLEVVNISKASADQRAGRAGREGLGYCVRLWNEQENIGCELYAPAEIHRGDIGAMVLSLMAVGVADIEGFSFFEQPAPQRVRAAIKTLKILGMVDESGKRLTGLGRKAAHLSLSPRYGRMMMEAVKNGVLKEVSIIVALLSSGQVFTYPTDRDAEEIDNIHRVWTGNSASDCFTLLNIFAAAKENLQDIEWFAENLLNYDTISAARFLRWDILRALRKSGINLRANFIPNWRISKDKINMNNLIQRTIISGLLDQIAIKKKGRQYHTVAGLDAMLARNSVVKGKLIVGTELIRMRNDRTPRITCATEADVEILKQIIPQLLQIERSIIRRFPAVQMAQIRERVQYFGFVLSDNTRLVSENKESLPQRMALLRAAIADFGGAAREERK